MTEPTLPYPEPGGQEHTAGWSGSETSQERAVSEARDGTASARQRYAMDLVTERRSIGMTWAELALKTGWHHGSVSSVLSVMHQAGQLARLREKRNRSKIYVHPSFVGSRMTEAPSKKLPVNLVERILVRCVPDGDCLVWTGSRQPKGYGHIGVKVGDRKETLYVHRVMYEAAYGELDKGIIVRHTCDNPPCVNVAHLIEGTYADNTADMLERDRQPQHMRLLPRCKRGHDDWRTTPSTGDRYCRTCKAERELTRTEERQRSAAETEYEQLALKALRERLEHGYALLTCVQTEDLEIVVALVERMSGRGE